MSDREASYPSPESAAVLTALLVPRAELLAMEDERDAAVLRADRMEHELRRKIADCGCDGQAYEDIRAERDAALAKVQQVVGQYWELDSTRAETLADLNREIAAGNRVRTLCERWIGRGLGGGERARAAGLILAELNRVPADGGTAP